MRDKALTEIRYHLLMARGRLHAVEDTVARNSLDRRLTNIEDFIEYLRSAEMSPKE